MEVAPATAADAAAVVELRCLLWPADLDEQVAEVDALTAADSRDRIVWLARDGNTALGFAEATLRHDYVNGCETTPVVFLEAIYVRADARRRGVAAALCAAIAQWGSAAGCREFASDAGIDNYDSHAFHRALGFAETERVVFFRRLLDPGTRS